LSARTEYVEVECVRSDRTNIECGVPQGCYVANDNIMSSLYISYSDLYILFNQTNIEMPVFHQNTIHAIS